MPRLSPSAVARLHSRAETLLRSFLATTVRHEANGGLVMGPNPVPGEIALRIKMNAEIVEEHQLRDQVLAVLSDYRDHAWTWRRLAGQQQRNALADKLLAAEPYSLVVDSNMITYLKEEGYGFIATVKWGLPDEKPKITPINKGVDMGLERITQLVEDTNKYGDAFVDILPRNKP